VVTAARDGIVLVTGGAGFIGSHVVDALLASGRRVRVVDVLLANAHVRHPDYLATGAEYVFADVADTDAIEHALDGVTDVCHQASMVGLGVDLGDITEYVRHNDVGTAALLHALHRRGFGGRIVLGSSMVVYGEGRYRCERHGVVRPPPRPIARLEEGRFEPPCSVCGADLTPEPVPEDAPVDPRNVYAATKLHQEHLCAAYAREHGTEFVALRYHNVYGPRMPRDTPYAGVASIFRSELEAGRPPRVFEDGAQRRDFVHVRDVARANVAALTDGAPSGTFNIASGDPHTVGEMAHELARAHANGAAPIVTGEYRLGDVRHVFASIDRAAAELGFIPEVAFGEGVREFAAAQLRET
jgi:dTDP-L-rhamnose 4-epimerase